MHNLPKVVPEDVVADTIKYIQKGAGIKAWAMHFTMTKEEAIDTFNQRFGVKFSKLETINPLAMFAIDDGYTIFFTYKDPLIIKAE